MRQYRSPKSIIIDGRARIRLVPIPGAPGQWLTCSHAVRVSCPACGSGPDVPCKAKRGHVALTTAQMTTVEKLINGWNVSPGERTRLKAALDPKRYYRAAVHREREKAYQDSPGYSAGGRQGPTPAEQIKRLRGELKKLKRRIMVVNAYARELNVDVFENRLEEIEKELCK